MCEDLKDVMNDIRQQILESSVSMYSREYQEDLLYERYIEDLLYVIFCRIISQSSDKLPSNEFQLFVGKYLTKFSVASANCKV